ncbi:MAG: polysaccharide pyruvyl transferase family protein [Prolixibacteraceae bacterium]|jgi:polysaccharide pyruvyl transferase WcaK-like protein
MKIGIITYHYGLNCGAILQAYALQTQIERLGHDVEFIDYRPKVKRTFHDYVAKSPLTMIKKWIDIYNIYKYNRIDTFGKVNKRSKKKYLTINELRSSPPRFDVYITGSDQLWNFGASAKEIPYAFLLDFGSDKTKRISFAVSLGQGFIPDILIESFKARLLKFNAISVRETSGCDVVQSILDDTITVKHIQDPTILLNAIDYMKIAEPVEINDHLVVSYILSELNNDQISIIKSYCFDQKLDWINLRNPGSCMHIKNVMNKIVNPYQWLSYVKKSKFMICGSFHAVIFSLIFHKPFIVMVPELITNQGGNQRINSILCSLGLLDRYVSKYSVLNINDLFNKPIEWDFVDQWFSEQKKNSIDFLKENLVL